MSVYEETGAGSLTRTKDLSLPYGSLATRMRDKVVLPRQRNLATYA